jgi:hypothetical protein
MIILGCSSGSTYVIPAKAGIQLMEKFLRSGQNRCYVPLRGDYSIIWIPAFAGMTRFFANFGLMTDGRRIA